MAETITGADYGKSINYKATVQGQEVSNWRVFLNDGSNVYIILDDYLPNRLISSEAILNTNGEYSVYSNQDRVTLLNGLNTTSNWIEFANGVEGAVAKGSPTNAQFVTSWNENPVVNARKLQIETIYGLNTNGGVLSDPTKLYIPHTEVISNCWGYWLASLCAEDTSLIWRVSYNNIIDYGGHNNPSYSVRPVVCLPSTLEGIVGETVEIVK